MADYGLSRGAAKIRSVGPLAFGPENVLFVADNESASVFAIDVDDDAPAAASEAFDLDDLDAKLAAFLGCSVDDVLIRDMAVHPSTHNVYLSIMRGMGESAQAVLVKVDHRDASIAEVPLDDVSFARVSIANAPTEDDDRIDFQLLDPPEGDEIEIRGRKIRVARQPARTSTVTDLAYVDGTLLVAGMSNEEFSSNLRRIPFPFTGGALDNSLEIFHVAHGKWETAAPIRTFMPYDDGRSILASYTCTPLVHFSLQDLEPGTKTVGRTVAELGAGNQPQDIVSFRQGDAEYLLICHSSHPLTKIACADVDAQGGLTDPQEPVGVPREQLDIPGVRRLASLNGDFVLALVRDDNGSRHLRSLKTASL
jgi:hypothetical protein